MPSPLALDTAQSGVPADDPHGGKALFRERTGLKQTYYSFDHGGWHFAVLDTVQITVSATGDRSWRGFVSNAQLAWLAADLEKTGKAVLQDHTQTVEEIASLGTRYISAGAVCGNWWKG